MSKKKLLIVVAIVPILFLLLFPTRVYYEDGGSVGYKAPLYEVVKLHQLSGNPYIEGIEIKVLGISVYRDTNE